MMKHPSVSSMLKRVVVVLLLAWFVVPTGQSWAAVAFDAKPTAYNSADGLNQQASNVTTISATTGYTIGVGATLLVATIVFQNPGLSAPPTSVTMTWDSVSMTARSNVNVNADAETETAYIFTLVNPNSGAKTLTSSWTTAQDVYMSAVSFTGTDTVTGIDAADNTTATNVTTITVPSDVNGATVACFVTDGATPTVNFTKIWAEAPLNPGGGGSYTLGGTSNGHTFTGAGGTGQALAGVHVIAAAGGGAGGPVGYRNLLGVGQ